MNLQRIEREYDDWVNSSDTEMPDEVTEAIPELIEAAQEAEKLRSTIRACTRIIDEPTARTNPVVALENIRKALR